MFLDVPLRDSGAAPYGGVAMLPPRSGAYNAVRSGVTMSCPPLWLRRPTPWFLPWFFLAIFVAGPMAVRAVGQSTARGAAGSGGPGPAAWLNDLTPIGPSDWNADRAAHLIERAGFGASPEEVNRFAAMTPRQ